MRRHLLYIASAKQVELTRESLTRLPAKAIQSGSLATIYEIQHSSLGGLVLYLSMLSDLNAFTPHLRQSPVDLLIYDEREGGIPAIAAVKSISEDVQALTDLWGADFEFTTKRIIAILEKTEDAATKTFVLGRYHVKDVLIAPRHISKILRWITRLLLTDLEQNEYKTGVALAGGGLEGFLFSLGCAYALEKSLNNRSLHDCDVFSGVSSGSLGATTLAAKIPLDEVIRALKGKSKKLRHFRGSQLYDFAGNAILRRLIKQLLEWNGIDPAKWTQKMMRSIPTGFFRGDALKNFIDETLHVFNAKTRFNELDVELFVGTTNQDTFEHVVMGIAPWDDVKLSDAVRASCALPPFFVPHKIKGQAFIDGQITKTCNLELMIKRGCNLIFIIDPLLPYTTFEPGAVEALGGVHTLIQTIKTLVYTRFRYALTHVTDKYPDVDFLVFQPIEECAQAMQGSPMKYKANTNIIDLSYRTTLRRLRERHRVYSEKLIKYGFHLRSEQELLTLERRGIEI